MRVKHFHFDFYKGYTPDDFTMENSERVNFLVMEMYAPSNLHTLLRRLVRCENFKVTSFFLKEEVIYVL